MLAKEPDDRYQLIHEVRTDLAELIAEGGDSQEFTGEILKALTPATAIPARWSWRPTLPLVAVLFVGAIMASLAIWNLTPSPETATGSITRLVLPLPTGLRPTVASLILSPDGSYLAFTSRRGGVRQLYLRAMESLETNVVPDTEDASRPFFSPDGRWVGFFAGGNLKKVSISGGLPVVLCDAPAGRGGSWGENGTIVFTPSARAMGLSQVSAEGGTPQPITTLDSDKGESSHRWPHLLPGGEVVLFTAYGATFEDVQIIAHSLQTGEQQVLIEGGSQARYVSSGHLLYVQPRMAGTLMAVPFDAERLELTGTPVPIVEGVGTPRGDTAGWSVSRLGTLVYLPGGLRSTARSLVWVNREGEAEPLDLPPGPYEFPRLSPDGRQVVVRLGALQSSLWIYDLIDKTFNRLTFEGNDNWPLWTPDGKRVVYASNRAEPYDLYWIPVDGSGKEELLLAKPEIQVPHSFSPDGKILAHSNLDPTTAHDVWLLPLADQQQPRPVLQTPAVEFDAQFSPDGRYLAYASNESGRNEVYVRPFPNLQEAKWQISTQGGREAKWAHSGNELFYRSGEGMMAVEITTQPSFRTGTPRLLFEGPYRRSTTPTTAQYDVSADGQRFLMVQEEAQEAEATQLNVVLNWFEELKRVVPTEP
jgi:serine/threonine-protein kinase